MPNIGSREAPLSLSVISIMKMHGNIDTKINCALCGGEYTVRDAVLLANEAYRELDVVSAKTPCCSRREELWLRDAIVSRGYVYAAGQAHFADMENYEAPGLVVEYSDDEVSLRLGDYETTITRGL